MASGRVQDASGYAAVTAQLAGRALASAIDNAPHRPRQGELRWPMARALNASRVLIGQADNIDVQLLRESAETLATTLTEPTGKITDGFGHNRPVYAWLALHIMGTAAKTIGDAQMLDHVRQATDAAMQRQANDDDPRLAVWRRLVASQHGIGQAEDLPLPAEEPAPLKPLGLNDLIDAWTYRELIGMHGLYLCARLAHDDALLRRAEQAALYHLGHTQPDYTTYQPWALAAFASNPQTAVFAEQQLHDVATHLSIEGPGGAVLPALLLAEAAATMSGTMALAWRCD